MCVLAIGIEQIERSHNADLANSTSKKSPILSVRLKWHKIIAFRGDFQIGAHAPAGTPPTPYSTGPLPQSSGRPGLSIVAPDGVSTRTVKAVPCGAVARENDEFTTCVGITDHNSSPRERRVHRRRP
jgi:hypothetical protein